MKLILDYSTWRSGGDGLNRLGIGITCLHNENGFMCCLGGWMQQEGFTKNEIHYKTDPQTVKADRPSIFKVTDGEYETANTEFADRAMKINDDPELTIEQRIDALRILCTEFGHELVVINKPA